MKPQWIRKQKKGREENENVSQERSQSSLSHIHYSERLLIGFMPKFQFYHSRECSIHLFTDFF